VRGIIPWSRYCENFSMLHYARPSAEQDVRDKVTINYWGTGLAVYQRSYVFAAKAIRGVLELE
jgi:hypothetical protein